jgi:hypothetical protein
MTFDNSKTIISLRIKLFATTVILLTYIVLVYVAKLIKFPLLGMSDTLVTLVLVGIYLIMAFLPMILNYQYIWFSDDEEKIIIRYFMSGIIGGRKNSVEINKATFAGYKIEKEYLGLSRSISLFQRVGQGTAKYPPIHITALSKEERSKMLRALMQYAPEDRELNN